MLRPSTIALGVSMAVLSALPACGGADPPPTGKAEQGVVRGQATKRNWRAVKISMSVEEAGKASSRPVCSGNLIAPGIVLTAAHCVHGFTLFGLSFPAFPEMTVTTKKAALPPGYTGDPKTIEREPDLALVLFDPKRTDPEKTWSVDTAKDPEVGARALAVPRARGLAIATGRMGPDGEEGAADEYFYGPELAYAAVEGAPDQYASAQAVHPGDSGGAVFAPCGDGKDCLVGVNSHGRGAQCKGTSLSYEATVFAGFSRATLAWATSLVEESLKDPLKPWDEAKYKRAPLKVTSPTYRVDAKGCGFAYPRVWAYSLVCAADEAKQLPPCSDDAAKVYRYRPAVSRCVTDRMGACVGSFKQQEWTCDEVCAKSYGRGATGRCEARAEAGCEDGKGHESGCRCTKPGEAAVRLDVGLDAAAWTDVAIARTPSSDEAALAGAPVSVSAPRGAPAPAASDAWAVPDEGDVASAETEPSGADGDLVGWSSADAAAQAP